MGLPIIKSKRKAARRYGIYYYKMVGDFAFRHDTSGSTSSLVNAIGNAVKHCARSELQDGEYAQALIFDRHRATILRSYKLAAGSKHIVCKEYV